MGNVRAGRLRSAEHLTTVDGVRLASPMPMKNARFESRTSMPAGEAPSPLGRWIMRAVMALVLLIGLSALTTGLQLVFAGDRNRAGAVAAVILGIVLSGLSAWYFYASIVSRPLREARLSRTRALYPDQPWMERPDWQARRIVHSAAAPALFLWIWTLGWWGALAFIGTVNRDKIAAALAQSWWNYALGGIFVGAGLLGLLFALNFTWAWWRYGRSHLLLDTLPAVVGERFVGTLEARLKPAPASALQVELVCEALQWVTTRSGSTRSSRLDTRLLGRGTATADPRRLTPGRDGLMRGRIEVEVPPGLPSSHLDAQGNGIRWQLRIATTGDAAPFSCAFDVPVYEADGLRRS